MKRNRAPVLRIWNAKAFLWHGNSADYALSFGISLLIKKKQLGRKHDEFIHNHSACAGKRGLGATPSNKQCGNCATIAQLATISVPDLVKGH